MYVNTLTPELLPIAFLAHVKATGAYSVRCTRWKVNQQQLGRP